MRRYRIELSGPFDAVFDSTNADGSPNPGALDIELDVSVYTFAAPIGYALVRVWGLPLTAGKSANKLKGTNLGPADATISQATDFNQSTIKVFAGMQKGLPLANPAQYGLILQGKVFQAFGNWVETEMTLDLIVATDGGATQSDPANIVLDWKKGDTMASAIQTTLQKAYPDLTIQINISSKLVLTQDEQAHYQTLEQFAQYVNETSLSIIPDNYSGVDITKSGNTIVVFDGTNQATPKNIAFTDMIGQPTWIGPSQVQVNCVLRSDISVSDFIKFPPAAQTSTQAELGTQAADHSAFQGVFQVNMVRHVGHFRQPNAASWVTTINCYVSPPKDTGGDPGLEAQLG